MKKPIVAVLWIALGLGCGSGLQAGGSPYVEEVVSYTPGEGYAKEFGSGAGYTNTAAVMGPPSRVTVDPDPQWGGTFPVTPFAPPYRREQLLSIGAGGQVTVRLGRPIVDDPSHPFGIDFIVYGNAGFVITNGDFTGGGITDGSLFGAAEGPVRVEVSKDNVDYYTLNPSLAPVFDSYYPTDGQGTIGLPVDPSLRSEDFAGKDLVGIRALYGGSAGGTGYDLAWAVDEQGRPVSLEEAWYVRLSVLSGHAEVDAIALAVPEPGSGALFGVGIAMGWIFWRRRAKRNF